jgi:S1-C subfamily serine protease
MTGYRRTPLLRVAALAAAGLLLAACSASIGSGHAQQTTNAVPVSTPSGSAASDTQNGDRVVQVVNFVEPAVVSVTATTTVSNPFLGDTTQQGEGSGFIVSAAGWIFTNDHVIENASKIRVTLADGRAFDASVADTDAEHDFAVLHIDAKGLPTVKLGRSSTLELGQSVVAIGYALGLSGGPTVTSGIISSLERTVQAQDPGGNGTRTYRDVLQTSAAINPGNSGGPLVDLDGSVIGVNTASVTSADNIGFAIGIDAALPFIRSAIEG